MSSRRVFSLDENSPKLDSGANDNWAYETGLNARELRRPLGGRAKRVLDVVVASCAMLITLPVMLVVAAILKFSGNQALFVHKRIGLNGQAFDCYKFRTMVTNPEEKLQKFLAETPEAAAEWRQNQKLKHDPRVTFFGRMLRKSSIDELPQLLNVLRGEMSCVGPRPVTAGELHRYGKGVDKYLSCRPGITGLWQVNGRNKLNYEQRVELDKRYVDTWSFRGDLEILLRTAFAVMRFDETS